MDKCQYNKQQEGCGDNQKVIVDRIIVILDTWEGR